MKRLFCLTTLALMTLLIGCSGDQQKNTGTPIDADIPTKLDYPIVVGLPEIDAPKDTLDQLDGSVKLWFNRPAIAVEKMSCEGDVHTYSVAYSINVEVAEAGKIYTSIGLRTGKPNSEYTWFAAQSSDKVTSIQTLLVTSVAVSVPKDEDIHIKLVSVGGDSLNDHSSRHYDEYTPQGDIPAITSTQCQMDM